MSSGKNKRRRTDYHLPSLDSVFHQNKANKTHLLQGFSQVSQVDLQHETCDLNGVPENALKVCWVIAKFSIEVVMKVTQCQLLLPSGLTENQRKHVIASRAGISVDDATFIGEFVRDQCPSLMRASMSQNSHKILGPPTSVCYECGSNLVQYHQCSVRCFSTSGFENSQKITLRCTNCSLFYNYAQFGNKRKLGFRFYPEPRDYIEANDAVLIHRKLLELQCSLA